MYENQRQFLLYLLWVLQVLDHQSQELPIGERKDVADEQDGDEIPGLADRGKRYFAFGLTRRLRRR